MSLVEVKITFEIERELVFKGVLKKSLAPLTIKRLLTNSPYNTRCYFFRGKVIYFPIGLIAGEEKSTYNLKKGDIFYWITGKSLGIALDNVRFPQRVNLLGKLSESTESLTRIKRGVEVIIKLEE